MVTNNQLTLEQVWFDQLQIWPLSDFCNMTEEYKCFAWKILQVLFFNKKDIKASEKGVGGLSTRITAPSFVIHLRIRPDLRKKFSWQNSFQDSISSEDNLTKYLLLKLIVDIRPGSLSVRIPYCVFFLRNWMLWRDVHIGQHYFQYFPIMWRRSKMEEKRAEKCFPMVLSLKLAFPADTKLQQTWNLSLAPLSLVALESY